EEEEEEEEGQIEGTEGETVTELEELGEEVATEEDTAKATWQPTDYKPGDIEEDEYTVKNGDTLWEIAEARYGSGFEWTKIRDANSEQIGYLPDGSQALIEVGQTLVLP
ncbi:MAG: LysM peptidoglycan-binding domain-containing protein, partial [Patescibacteria group bacterium]